MIIYIAGIVHFDVLGPDKLKKWFNELSEKNECFPEFVAVEWDENIFNQIISQRCLIREYAKNAWPKAPSSFLDKIEMSLGYEGDTHKNIFPNIDTLWLDQNRQINDKSIVTQYASVRMNQYKSYFRETPQDFGRNTLIHMSKEAWDRSSRNDAVGSERDVQFSKAIISRLNKPNSNWSIVVVGASHARTNNGFMAELLEDAGLPCYVTLLSPI